MSFFNVTLTRGNGASPWGFRLQGGADFRSPLVLQKVNLLPIVFDFKFMFFLKLLL